MTTASGERVLVRFTVASEPGNERLALAQVAEAVAGTGLTDDQLDRLKTAVAEATMNAIEHGNHNQADVPVDITVVDTGEGVAVSIVDQGGAHAPATAPEVELPDLDKKLAGLQSPRGWGLFLIQNMVDAMDVSTDGDEHTVRLLMRTTWPPRPRDPKGGSRAEQM
ncbi:MAG TPA: ATP-binding protein [Mycobacteriales bacterium]|nr:ATP-binding protein [Mycobacteriales bacterium]